MTNKNATKRALVSSVLALFLCFAMLLGTTYAWFTDEVTSANNIITSGTLDVEMFWAEGTENPATADWQDASTTAIFDYDNWEPGYVDVKHVKVSNGGTLALKYTMNIKANGEVSKLAEVIDVYFVDPATQVSNRSDLLDADKVGTLADILSGEVAPVQGDLLKGESDIITIALKMQESAGNEYQNLSVGTSFSVQILATQLASEEDSFGGDYDANAVTRVTYDETKTVAENAVVLADAFANAKKGDIILIGAGNWYATTYQQFKVTADDVTIVGENGAVLGYEEENRNSILIINGDNVTVRNLTFNANKQEYNQLLLAIGAENLTVDSCTFYGENYQGGNTPTMGIYILENLDTASDEANDAVTKYTITNNNFIGAAIGSYKGGAAKVTTDPGVATAQVSEDMIIANNVFVRANILIENWRSWSLECTRDHEFVPTIENNIFESPNLCFANTPHSIYLRCYRQGNPDQILPADYIDNFVANNTIATPANDTVVNYGGQNYVLSNDYDTFYRDNATYGTIAYCYGQSYTMAITSAEDLVSAVTAGGEYVLVNDIAMTSGVTIDLGKEVVLDLNGKTISGTDSITASFGLITNKGTLTIKDSVGTGKITLKATENRGWNAYSSVISNSVGGKLVVENGTIEHLGGTDMAYAIDNLTNGKGTCAETVINGGTIKSTYRAIRQFLNGVEADNILTVNGGIIEGANKSIWMQDPSKNSNSGKLTVGANAELNGDVYLFVTAGSTEWPVEVSINAAALADGAEVISGNVPEGYEVALIDGCYVVK